MKDQTSARELVVVSHGMLGSGFPEVSLERAVAKGIDLIAVDGGSTDPGPHYLGSGKLYLNPQMVSRDIALLLEAQEASGAKIVIGSAGGAGGDGQVDQTMALLREEIVRGGWRRKVAIVRSELSKDEIHQAVKDGKVRAFESGVELTPAAIDESLHIVAQIGVEPMIEALKSDPDIVLCGRAWDPANIAALPIARGFDPGLSIHAGKILECGALAALPPTGADLLMGRIRENDFIIEPCTDDKMCTVDTVAAHTFYEKTDPVHLPGPGGWSDLRKTTFEQLDPRRVRVAGSRFVPDKTHCVKIEGARLAGWRYISIAGIRDPMMIKQIDEIQRGVVESISRLMRGKVNAADYKLTFHRYGRDGVMGPLEPVKHPAHELGLLMDVVGRSEQVAVTVITTVRNIMMHWPYVGRIATAGNLALPFSPAEFSVGPVYEFNIYHLLDIDNPAARFTSEIEVVQ